LKTICLPLILAFLGLNFSSFAQSKKISLDDIYKNYIFYPNSIDNLRSMNDGEYYTILEEGSLISRWNYGSGEKKDVIFNAADGLQKGINDYEFSADEKKILISTSIERIYRRSFRADYFIYSLETKELKPLSVNGKQQLATFSPNGQQVAFVRDNNLFVVDLLSMSETQITQDGETNSIINGATDWVYEEEFGFVKGFEWSPDSRKIAFFRFDESGVKEFSMTMYKDLYPDEYRFKYPKAGEANSIVSIHSYDLASGKIVRMDIGSERDQYIGRIFWTKNPETISMIRINRLQNKRDILHANALTGISEVVFS